LASIGKKTNPWLQLVKRKYFEIKSKEKLSGTEALKKAIEEAKKIWRKFRA